MQVSTTKALKGKDNFLLFLTYSHNRKILTFLNELNNFKGGLLYE